MEGVQDGIKPNGQIVYAHEDIYGLIGEVTIILEDRGLIQQSEEFVGRAINLSSYNEVLELSQNYVQFPSGGSNEPEAN